MTVSRFLFVAALAASSSIASAQSVNVTLTEWKVVLSRDTVSAGPVTFRLTNGGVMTHAFYIRGPGVAKGAKEIPTKQSGALTVTLRPGTYEVYCPMSDMSHKQAGMSHQLVVIAAPSTPETKKP